MDDLEQTLEMLRGDVNQLKERMADINQLKEQVAKILEVLQSGEKRNHTDGNPSIGNEERSDTPSHPPGFNPTPVQPQGANPQRAMVPLTMYAQPSTVNAPLVPLYGLPHGYVPPQATTFQEAHIPPGYMSPQPSNPQDSNITIPVSEPQNFVQPHDPKSVTHTNPHPHSSTPIFIPYTPIPGVSLPQTTNSPNGSMPTPPVLINSSLFPHGITSTPLPNPSTEAFHSKEKLDYLEERIQAIEGISGYGFGDAAKLCLVPNVVIPLKFKVPEFDKYKGTTCPKFHLTMYCRKMAAYAQDEKLLIHFFQDSLAGAAASWYMHLERNQIRSWKDLVDAFLKQYKYNIDVAPDRTQLQNMTKKGTETFKEYAQRWRELAAQVEPPLSEKEVISMFIDTLQSPFYDRIIGSASSSFADIIIIGERIESGLTTGRLSSGP